MRKDHLTFTPLFKLIIAGNHKPEFNQMDVLATLIEAYEAKHYPIEMPHLIEAIEIRLRDKGMSRRDLRRLTLISETKLDEALDLEHPLSLNMIRRIGPLLDLPLELLVQPYKVTRPQPGDA